jgi:glyoxylase-like metal-dependent hydrolase (beta-lactamase superfamily II)/rhodanese-related sulfurtransferase
MYFKQILNEDSGCSSYVIASRQSKEAVIVDPAFEIEQYLQLAARREFRIILVVDTHIHADHVSGARRLAAQTGAQVAMHESTDVLFPFRKLHDGEVVAVGQLRIEVMHTPGHRPEGLSLLVTNPPRGDNASFVLTGDSLFVGDVGRPDFGGEAGAAEQYASVHRLMELDDFVEVFPAHFEGACGKGMCGRPSSTIGFERRYNPLLQLDRDQFVAATSEAPAQPLNMTAIIATNRGEADFAWAEPRITDGLHVLDVEEARQWIARHDAAVLDVREPEEYQERHVPGALSVPQSNLASVLADLSKDTSYAVICAGGVRSLRAAHYLASQGFKVISIAGGTDAWVAAGLDIEGQRPGPTSTERQETYQHGSA